MVEAELEREEDGRHNHQTRGDQWAEMYESNVTGGQEMSALFAPTICDAQL